MWHSTHAIIVIAITAPITSKIKHAIKLAIKLKIITSTTSDCNKSPARLAQLLQPSLASFFLQPMAAFRPSRRRWRRVADGLSGTPSLAAKK